MMLKKMMSKIDILMREIKDCGLIATIKWELGIDIPD